MATLNDDMRALGERLVRELGGPRIDGLYLPEPVADETFRDAFGFVFLDDGSVGPFYVSLDDMLRRLWRRHPHPARFDADPRALLRGLHSADPVDRGFALGTYNALGAALLRRSAYAPPDRADAALPSGAEVGMVGYFAPLIDRLSARGQPIRVLEQAPQRVADDTRVRLVTDAIQLRHCAQVLCSASTLVNDTLPALLDALGGTAPVTLIGPSGSGLPDPLFAHGVGTVGGVTFDSRAQLLAVLAAGRSWGETGRKYELDAASYPGADTLLAQITRT
ncbi:MAG: DUF364 domain-containing protein [Gammaproteobacteria bacterium]|nr:DUF364 domain-containing protein [Gammaproteobacteria bacterium]